MPESLSKVSINIQNLVNLRHLLHQHAEVSNKEQQTARIITDFVREYQPDKIINNIGGHGLAAIFKGETDGPTVIFRCELDALPIPENNDFSYISKNKEVGHKCGHDGHMAMVSGIGPLMYRARPKRGRVVLLFQPAEESGQGAQRIIRSRKFKPIEPDYIFAIHNLPGYGLGRIVTRKEHFAAASKGMVNKLYGETSHAGEPENGNSPAIAMSNIVREITELPKSKKKKFKDFVLATIIHTRLGEIAFGTTPGYAEVMATLRAYLNEDMDRLTHEAEQIVSKRAGEDSLEYEISYREAFPATINDDECVESVEKAANANNYKLVKLKQPFRWSEDFGQFTSRYKGALFGLGAGVDHPQLHNSDFDFPDDLIPYGVNMYARIIDQLLNQ